MKSSSIIKVSLVFCTLLMCNCSANGPGKIVIITEYGDIELQLYDQTPQHRDNFIKLVKEGYYDGVLFHRVIKSFMIQSGDPDTRNAKPGTRLGTGGPGHTVPAEFVPEYIHKRGALAAARQDVSINPEKASSGSQFYIVQGKVYTDEDLNREEERLAMSKARPVMMEYVREEEEAMRKAGQTVDPEAAQAKARERAMKYLEEHPYRIPEEARRIYKTIGGTPFLDTEYTVFGEVTKGMDIVDRIADMETDQNNRPKTDVKIKKVKATY